MSSKYYQPPNKRLKTMSGEGPQKVKGEPSSKHTSLVEVKGLASAFLQAEEQFHASPTQEEWKVQKGRQSRQNRPLKPREELTTKLDFGGSKSLGRNRDGENHETRGEGKKRHLPNNDKNTFNKRPGRNREKNNSRGERQQSSQNCHIKKINNRSCDRNSQKIEEENQQDQIPPLKSQNKSDSRQNSGFTFTKLQQIATKDSTDIIRILANSQSGLDEFLKGKIKPDFMYLIVKILSKLTASDWEENKEHVLMRSATPEFFKKITEFVTCLVTDEQSIKRREEMEQFFENLLTFFQAIMTMLPTVAAEHLTGPMRATKMAIGGVAEYQNVTINMNVHEKMKLLMSDFEERKKEKEERDKIMKENVESVYPKPLGSISDVPLYPRPEDIDTPQGAVMPNKIKGPYKNVEQYLDVQFRLLREDFISPVRQGINEYRIGHNSKNPRGRKRVNNIRIYHRVKFLKPKVIFDKVGYDVCIDPEKRLRCKWEHSKRFIHGSLLLFTSDNFRTFFLATVVNRDLDLLEKNRTVSVILCDTNELAQNILSKEFLMAESEVYFEPYYNVLKALQRFNSDSFPMKKYFVYVETKTDRPAYTRNGGDIYTISLGDNGSEGRKTIKLFDPLTWPSCEELGFDSSQMNAFKEALTNDLVVIQGPPGTGKTYLGLKIAAALLENSVIWNYDHKSPILVICYTNHALDQFLEGIISKGLTNNIVRIGGRSKSELLENFNLKERRKTVAYYSASYEQAALLRDLKKEMSSIFESIKTIQDNLEYLDKNDGIISLKTLKLGMRSSQNFFFKNNDDIIEWLLLGVSQEIRLKEKFFSTEDKGIKRERSENVLEEFEFDPSDYENATRLKEVLFDSIELEKPEEDSQDSISKLRLYFSCTLDDIQKKMEENQKLIDSLPNSEEKREIVQQKMKVARKAEGYLKQIHTHFSEKLKNTPRPSPEETSRLFEIENLNSLTINQRWLLYKSWIEYLKSGYWMMIGKLEERYRRGARRYDEVRQFDDLRIVQQADVVGITTTTAARLQAMLRELKPKIVIVEEAAEVLEAHIIASLSVYCQHLILIGDHKQLRPSPASYHLAKDYHLDISLFERLINNGISFHTLFTQHRMRPEISRLLVPTIYPSLEDHVSTKSRQRVRGMDHNLFFMTHNNLEEEAEDIMSKRNHFEARMVMLLARHLLLQGYRPDEITVLTTYNGQMFLIKEEQRRLEISKDLLVTVVDNFQGEENKIILLSLVRSNADNRIGFLKTENRVCVALSRARDGLFVFGNIDCLTADSTLWQRIKQSFTDQNAFGPALVLRCETHRNQYTRIVTPDDFTSVMEGGCSKPCGESLPCGHLCKSLCHVSKDRHIRYRCNESCNRLLCADRHPCPKKCYQDCGECIIKMERTLNCGHKIILPCNVNYRNVQCKQLVTVSFPECKHEVQVECFCKDYKQCPLPCPFRLECGHSCTKKCHPDEDPDHLEYVCLKPCARRPLQCSTESHKCPRKCFEKCLPCITNVVRKLQCGHTVTNRCSDQGVLCEVSCPRILDCGHKCNKLCYEECGPCQVEVEKTVICGHKVKIWCSSFPTKKDCDGLCGMRLKCGHKCAKRCKDDCSELDCLELTPLPGYLPCGHSNALLPCSFIKKINFNTIEKEQLVQYCDKPCQEILKCSHKCSGTCGQCMQGRIHKVCDKDCGNTLICGHSCPVPCREVCPPCDKLCQVQCVHSKCPKKCGEPCVPCKEPCQYRCVHSRCTKRCWELCNRPPCPEACLQEFACGHFCVGFCGEPCPPCKICHPEEFEEIFYRDEESEEGARFVLLNDCKHVIESRTLDMWLGMDQEGSEIKLKACPKCSPTSPNRFIATTLRYMNIIKKTFRDIQAVKEKVYGMVEEIRSKREELLKEIKAITPTEMGGFQGYDKGEDRLITLRNTLLRELKYVKDNRRNEISFHRSCLLEYMFIVYLQVQGRVKRDWQKLTESRREHGFRRVNFFLKVLEQRKEKISKEEVSSFDCELKRLNRILDLLLIESNPNFTALKSLEPGIQYKIEQSYTMLKAEVFSLQLFKESNDKKVETILKEVMPLLNSVYSDEERKMVHRAMGFPLHDVNRWYKCAGCGDMYCVGDCGAVNQVARCGRCRTTIGDRNRVPDATMHRALQNNR